MQELMCFSAFLYQYISLLYSLRLQGGGGGGGGYSPPPPKSATGVLESLTLLFCIQNALMRTITSTVVVYIVMSSTPVELPALKHLTSIIIREFPCAWYYSITNFKIRLDGHITGFVMLLLKPTPTVIKLTASVRITLVLLSKQVFK